MAAPVLAGIPLVYEMLVGAGILAGGAVTANKMQKEIQKTIDTNPGVIDEALKNIFMGPAKDLINPKMLEEIQNVKTTTTAKKKTMPATEISPDDVMANTLFQEPTNNLFGMIDTPSGTVLAPDAADIEKQRKEAAPKPLVTPMPTGQQDQTLSTPTQETVQTQTETFPTQEPQQQNIGTPVPEIMDTSVLTKKEFERPDAKTRNKELKLADQLFKLSDQQGTLQDYESFKNNPIIENKIKQSNLAFEDTSKKEGYGTSDYWKNRKFSGDVVGYKDYIQKVYGAGAPVKNKEFYIVMGPSSSGKSTGLVNKLIKDTGSYLADSDEIKKTLPEFEEGYNSSGVHTESSNINGRIMSIAMGRGDNIVYPTTGREPGKLKSIIDSAEKKGYTVKVNLVTADRPVLLLRNLARILKTNRVVDGEKLLTEELVKGIEDTYNNLDEKYKNGKIDTTPRK
jgi:predicted ABC-type ATPase